MGSRMLSRSSQCANILLVRPCKIDCRFLVSTKIETDGRREVIIHYFSLLKKTGTIGGFQRRKFLTLSRFFSLPRYPSPTTSFCIIIMIFIICVRLFMVLMEGGLVKAVCTRPTRYSRNTTYCIVVIK